MQVLLNIKFRAMCENYSNRIERNHKTRNKERARKWKKIRQKKREHKKYNKDTLLLKAFDKSKVKITIFSNIKTI